MIYFLVVPSSSAGYASTDAYDSGDHGCDDAGISDPADRYINQPGKGPEFHTEEFMDGYDDGFYECSTGKNNPDSYYPDYFLDGGDGNVTLPAECGMRVLHDDQLFQPLSEHQCFFFNSCTNLGGSFAGCFEEARKIDCNIENGRYNCPIVLMDK